MKNLILALSLLFLAACAGGGSDSAPAVTAPVTTLPADNTPHDYVVAVYTNYGPDYRVTLHQQCAVGFPGHRDESFDFDFAIHPSENMAAIGCGTAENVILTATNTGISAVYLAVTVDGVYMTAAQLNLPGQVLNPGQTHTFTRGY